jgi:hypothetical protein
MTNYNNYLEQIKKKLDSMNKASGFNPQANIGMQKEIASQGMPSNEIFDMLGAGAKIYLDKKNQETLGNNM